jgi:hypothetical protein
LISLNILSQSVTRTVKIAASPTKNDSPPGAAMFATTFSHRLRAHDFRLRRDLLSSGRVWREVDTSQEPGPDRIRQPGATPSRPSVRICAPLRFAKVYSREGHAIANHAEPHARQRTASVGGRARWGAKVWHPAIGPGPRAPNDERSGVRRRPNANGFLRSLRGQSTARPTGSRTTRRRKRGRRKK